MSDEPQKRTMADLAVDRIVSDLEDRSALGDVWYNIPAETREEIRKEWARFVSEECDHG